MTDKPKRPRDANQLAHLIAGIATGEVNEVEIELSPEAKLGRIGGLKGGKARAKSLSSERRSEIARIAAAARYKNRND